MITPKCPHCGKEQTDFKGWDDSDYLGSIICQFCGDEFEVEWKLIRGEYQMPDKTSNHTIECPYCGEEHGDLWEWNINEFESYGEYECCECGKTFMLERHYDVWYTADKKEDVTLVSFGE